MPPQWIETLKREMERQRRVDLIADAVFGAAAVALIVVYVLVVIG